MIRITPRAASCALCLVAVTAATIAAAQTRVDLAQTVRRGPGEAPAIDVADGDALAAMRDSEGRLLLLHLATDADHRLARVLRHSGPLSAGHAVTRTRWDTMVVASLHADRRGDPRGALTLEAFAVDDDALRSLDRHRAGPAAPALEAAPTPLSPPSGVAPPRPRSPGVYGTAVAVAEVSGFLPDLGLGRERVATAIIDDRGRLRLDTWELDDDKTFRPLATDTSSGEASAVAATPWSRGVLTAVIDSAGFARFIAWEVGSRGGLARRGTSTSAVPATDVAIASFGPVAGRDTVIAAFRGVDGVMRVMLLELSLDGMTHRVVADGMGPRVRAISVTRSARVRANAIDPTIFYTVVQPETGGQRVMRWLVSESTLRVVAERDAPDGVTALAAGLDPYFPTPDDEDALVSLARDAQGRMRVDLWRSGFRRHAGPTAFAAPPTPQRGLAFSPNSPRNRRQGDDYPLDMPPPNLPTGLKDCSPRDIERINRAWTRAHYFMWRSNQVMEWLHGNRAVRKAAWEFAYDPEYGSTRVGLRNYTPRAFFGSYNTARFNQARDAIGKAWRQRFRDRSFEVICRTSPQLGGGAHPCYTMSSVAANHIVYGRINFCSRWLDRAETNVSDDARLIIHEVFHWLKIPNVV
ncbi:MAG: hypothetical protein EA355_00575, partial [Rhodobacteraceae bacterium]